MNDATAVEYRYDAWGKPISTEGSMAGTLGKDNPFRYRGYVCDEETGLYYLRSRYYDSSWGRFVNADVVLGKAGTLFSHNGFAYCTNNPMNMIDYSGLEPIWSQDNWSRVTDFSQEEAFAHSQTYQAHNDDKEKGALHILTSKGIVSIAVQLDHINNPQYHIDTRFQNESVGRKAMREIITDMKGQSELVQDTRDGFRIKRNPVKLPAILEMSDGTLASCAVQLYPHSGNSFIAEGDSNHFDVYVKQSSGGPSKLVASMQATARRAYVIAKMMSAIARFFK